MNYYNLPSEWKPIAMQRIFAKFPDLNKDRKKLEAILAYKNDFELFLDKDGQIMLDIKM